MLEDFDEEERVAVGLVAYPSDECRGGLLSCPGGHDTPHVRLVQTAQGQARDVTFLAQLREQLQQRVRARYLRVAIRPKHHEPHRQRCSHEVTQHQECGLVSPVQIVDEQ